MVSCKIIHRLIFFISFFYYSSIANCKLEFNDSLLINIINKSINYLHVTQIKDNNQPNTFVGEWPSYIYNCANIPFLGKKGKSAYDSNVFNTLFIHNAMAELYLTFNKNSQILELLSLAQKNFKYFKNESSFNFWPELLRPSHLKCKHKNCKQRRPVNFNYHYGFINNYANIYDDADDTSAGYLAYYLSNKVKDSSGTNQLDYFNTDSYFKNFVLYRDTGIRKTNWYNKKNGFKYRTGAFFTWFGPDRKPSHFFTWFFPYHHKQNILYGRNEVDCVVNANILKTLYTLGDTTISGVKESKEFLRKVIAKNKCQTCGVYYPTEFSFHYALAKAISAGLTGFNDLKEVLISEILKQKNQQGFWESQIEGNDVQCTLYALNAIMMLSSDKKILNEIEPGINFLLEKRINDQTLTHWNGGVFFSGGSAIRYEHVWISDAYTTCLAIETLTNYLNFKKQL